LAVDLLGPDFSKASYWTEFDAGGERLVMPIRRSLKVIGGALLGFGFVIFKAHAAFEHEPGSFEYLIFAGLIGGAIYLVLSIIASLLTREGIQISHGELVHGWRLLGLKREKRYLLRDVYQLTTRIDEDSAGLDKLVSPLKDFGKAGVVTFTYRGDTIGLGAGLDEAHGQRVVEWIAQRAPRNVIAA
jgi:hypothetical protein